MQMCMSNVYSEAHAFPGGCYVPRSYWPSLGSIGDDWGKDTVVSPGAGLAGGKVVTEAGLACMLCLQLPPILQCWIQDWQLRPSYDDGRGDPRSLVRQSPSPLSHHPYITSTLTGGTAGYLGTWGVPICRSSRHPHSPFSAAGDWHGHAVGVPCG